MKTNRVELLTGAAIVLLLIVLNTMIFCKYDGLLNVVGDDTSPASTPSPTMY